MQCENCNEWMKFCTVKNTDGFAWRCNSVCKQQTSIRKHSFFYKLTKPLKVYFEFLFHWSKNALQTEISRETKMDKNTMCNLSLKIRELIMNYEQNTVQELGVLILKVIPLL